MAAAVLLCLLVKLKHFTMYSLIIGNGKCKRNVGVVSLSKPLLFV